MPSTSPKQHRFMEAVAHNPDFARKAGVPQSVGKDFADADKGKSFAAGGPVNKGFMQKHQSFAEGGEVLGRTSKWFKTQDRFSENEGPLERNKTQDNFEKGNTTPSIVGAPPPRGKTLPVIKPRQ